MKLDPYYVRMLEEIRNRPRLGTGGDVSILIAIIDSMRSLLTIHDLMEANLSRVKKWHSLEGWTPLEWAGAMCGEAGEAANAAKKLKRITDQIKNNDNRLFGQEMRLKEQQVHYRKLVGKEVADTYIYGVLLCASVGMTADDMDQCIRDVFNKKSEEYNFPERI